MRRVEYPLLFGKISVEALIWIIVLVIIAIPIVKFLSLPSHADSKRKTSCTSNQKQIATAIMMYVQENNETLPPAENWIKAVDVRGKILNCPSSRDKDRSYAYNVNISNVPYEKLYGDEGEEFFLTIFTADSDAKNNIMRNEKDITFRHKGKKKERLATVSFTDGHVAMVEAKKITNFRFKIKDKKP